MLCFAGDVKCLWCLFVSPGLLESMVDILKVGYGYVAKSAH